MPKILGPITSKGGASQEFNIRNYGAKGNGTGDDGPALQKALDAAVAVGGGVIYCPPGTYNIASNPKILGSNITIKSDPQTTFKRTSNAIAFLQNGKTDGTDANGGYTGNGNITVDGGTWDMQGATYTTAQGCFGFAHAENITVKNVTIKDVPQYHAIEFNACKNVRVDSCRFIGYYWSASTANGGSETFPFEEAVQIDLARSFNIGPFDNTVCQDVRITNSYFGASGTAGTQPWPTAFGSHTSVIGRPHNRILFQGNTVESAGWMGIRGYNWDNVQIDNNKFISCQGGVRLCNVNTTETANSVDDTYAVTTATQHLYNFTVTNNVFKDVLSASGTGYDSNNPGHGITVIGYGTGRVMKNVVIADNSFDTMTTKTANNKAIHCNTVENLAISGNLVKDPADQGIGVYNSNVVSITGNIVNLAGDNGMHLDTNTDLLVSGNVIKDAWFFGILVNSGTNTTITGNNIKGAGRQAATGYAAVKFQGTSDGAIVDGNSFTKAPSGNTIQYGVISTSQTNITIGTNFMSSGLTNV